MMCRRVFHTHPHPRLSQTTSLSCRFLGTILSVSLVIQLFVPSKVFDSLECTSMHRTVPLPPNGTCPDSFTLTGVECTAVCHFFSFITQFSLLGTESWVLALGFDLVTALRNPFASYKQRLKLYHVVVHTVALLSAVVLMLSGKAAYSEPFSLNYIKLHRNENINGWLWVRRCSHFFSMLLTWKRRALCRFPCHAC